MSTNQVTPKIPQATINYFDEGFAKEGLKYVKRDLERQIEKARSDYFFYEEQSKQLATMAKIEQDRLEAFKYELASVNAAMKQKTAGII
jgi:hypothetical protein